MRSLRSWGGGASAPPPGSEPSRPEPRTISLTLRIPRPRKRWAVLATACAALALAVPAAWAAFSDVPANNPFHDDIDAIQGAGITSGCGGGKFCPNDNITRQAEAAFVHRNAPRTAYTETAQKTIAAAGTDLGSVSLDIGGVAGGTQFVVLNASITTYIQSTTGCPCQTAYVITDDNLDPVSATHFNLNTAVATDGFGFETGGATAVVPVDTGTTQTFHVFAYNDSGTGTVGGYAELSAVTAPFGSSGADALGAQIAAGPFSSTK